MFFRKVLCTLLVAMWMVVICKTNFYDDYLSDYYNYYAKKVSFYIRTLGDYIDPNPLRNNEPPKTRPLRNLDEIFREQNTAVYQKFDSNSCYDELRKCWLTKNSNDISEAMVSRRVVNMLLTRATVEEEGSVIRRHIVIETTATEQEALQKFGRGELNFRKIDPILSGVIKTPESSRFFGYIMMVYRFECRVADQMLIYKGTIVTILVLLFLCYTLYDVKWRWKSILFTIIKVYLTLTFLLSWWIVLRKANFTLEDMPIQCQPEKMRWSDRVLTWFKHYNCDKYRKLLAKDPSSEKTPQEAFENAMGDTIVEMVNLNKKILFGFFRFESLSVILQMSFTLFITTLVIMASIRCASFLGKIIKEPGKTWASIEKYISKFVRYLQSPLNATTTRVDKSRLPSKCTYHSLYCGTERSILLKIQTEAKSLEKRELEAKISSILGKGMEVDKFLGRLTTTYGEQITVAMKRTEDRDELIERRLQLRGGGIFVEEDIILLDGTAMWNLLGFEVGEEVEGESRRICVNGKEWIWNKDTREWVEKKL